MEPIADRPDDASATPATVLLVTGDPARRHAGAGRLREAGIAVHTAAGGPGALAAARRRPPDLLLLVARLPGDGLLVCQAVRAAADRRLRTVSILVLADGATERELIDGLEAGADAYVAAPISLRELQARVKALQRRAQRTATAAAAEPLVAGDLVLDPAGRRLLRRGRPVRLRPKEFALLAFLLRRPGQVLTSPQLLATDRHPHPPPPRRRPRGATGLRSDEPGAEHRPAAGRAVEPARPGE